MLEGLQKVADRYIVRLAAREACAGLGTARVASAGLTTEAVAAFGEHFYLPMHEGRVAFGGLVRKLKQLVGVFRKAPQLWERFKKLIGIKSLTDIPDALKRLAQMGKKALQKAVHKLFDTWPLKIYTLEKGKLKGFSDLLDRLMSKSPRLKKWLSSATQKFSDFGEMLRKRAPAIAGVLMVAIYIWIWMNVVEFEWDFKSLTDAITGSLTFPEFLLSLPGSAFGFLLNGFGFGTFTLLPYTVAARILYLLTHRYVSWTGRGFALDWDKMRQDFGVQPA